MMAGRLLIHNASEIVQVSSSGERFLKGNQMRNMVVLRAKEGESLAIAADLNGRIMAIGDTATVKQQHHESQFHQVIDAKGGCVLPGFVDAHTHPIWSGDRVLEFAAKLAGKSYMEIHAGKGGIHYSVKCTKEETDENLLESLKDRLLRFRRSGTTAAEVKTGYGLWYEDELRLLRILNKAKDQDIIETSITYLGAHSKPSDYPGTAAEFAHKIATEDLPKLNKLVPFDNCDVFCEKGVFETEASREILSAAKKLGYMLNFHAEELSLIHGVEMGCELGARAMSHLECVSDEGIAAMSRNNVAAVVLPTTANVLRIEPPPVRKMIDADCIVALGSDFNPNAYCYSMPTVMYLACTTCKMMLEEALVACTLNAAYSIGKEKEYGSLEIGKQANMVVIKEKKWEHIIYQLGSSNDLISHVVYKGNIV